MKRWIVYALPGLVVAVGVVMMLWLVKTAPATQRRRPPERATLVEITRMAPTNAEVVVEAMGTVVPARTITLYPRVSGMITAIHRDFEPGGRLAEGEVALQIDQQDYALAVSNRMADVVRAEYELALELGQQEIARHEWSLVPDREQASELEQSLTLRKPHLRRARANLDAARASLDDACLDLDRTQVRVPFNALVLDRHVDIGALVGTQTPLASLAGTDAYWVEATVPVDQLPWITIPGASDQTGSRVDVAPAGGLSTGGAWQGYVIRRRADLEPQGRLARLIVSIPQPVAQAVTHDIALPLLLDAYVKLFIHGPELQNVFVVPRRAVHDGCRIWIMNSENRLDIRDVEIVWRGPDTMLLRHGVKPGERLILTALATPVPGMLLQTEAMADSASGKLKQEPGHERH
jgi:RND family efflux transporter MFP subunit